MNNILWLACGGTISCRQTEKGLSPAADVGQLRKMLDCINIPPDTEITARVLMNTDSSDMDVSRLNTLARAVYEGCLQGHTGIVITHGTDTMAYTAAVLSCTPENLPLPVIITGSQRPFFESGSDGAANLSHALKAACDRRFTGVQLLFGDKIIPGDRAVKLDTRADNAFTSADGYSSIIKGDEFTDVRPAELNAGECCLHEISGNVRLIKLSPFTTGDEILAAVNSGVKGIALEGFGSCGIPGRLLPAVREAADRGVTVAFVSQCLYGGTDGGLYEVGVNAGEAGVVFGYGHTASGVLARLAVKCGS